MLELPHAERDITPLEFEALGGRMTVGDMIAGSYTDGFLVLHDGRTVFETYGPGMTPSTTHLLQSVSKSIGGTAAGGYNVIYDTHQYAIYTAVGMLVFFYLFFEIFFRV